ncbi:MAG: beta-N-acetylhexosaminidase [Pseudomonadales bacterium]
MQYGSLMLDVAGLCLSAHERSGLQSPHVGGVILFSRNYSDVTQLRNLVEELRAQNPALVIAVDHEGGRVQRFRDGFSKLPPMRKLGDLYQRAPDEAINASRELGFLMAAELVALDIDISFAPVLDLDWASSSVIGDRAFGDSAEQVISLCSAFIEGMADAGMAATGKHFPGHGWAVADSHLEQAVDERTLAQIREADLKPFRALIAQGLAAVMPAHVIYSKVDDAPCGFSPFWLQQVLREELGFAGVIFSDDLSMHGAKLSDNFSDRAAAALKAGCDTVLVCNDPAAAAHVLTFLSETNAPRTAQLGKMRRRAVAIDAQRLASARTIAASFNG